MLKVSDVSKTFAAETVLQAVSLTVSPGERLGLVGPNGAGKSTLLRLIAGDLQPDAGVIQRAPRLRVGYLPQFPSDELSMTAGEALAAAGGRIAVIRARVKSIEKDLAAGCEADFDEYAALHDEFDRLGGYAFDARVEQVGATLDITPELMTRRVAELSGGYKTKLSLARLLLADADIVLLDEPTTYLDSRALAWLERYVATGNRAFIIVSHDRHFLDRAVTGILEIDSETRGLRRFPGTYSEYSAARRSEVEKTWATYRDQQAEIARLGADIRRTRDQAAGTERMTTNDYVRGRAKKVAAKAKARERRLQRMIESEEMIEKPKRGWGLHLVDLPGSAASHDRLVLEMEDVRAGYGDTEVLHGVSLEIRARDRIVLRGDNGSGKTTLVGVIAGEIRATGRVRLGASIRPGFLSQETSTQQAERTVLDVFRERVALREDEARTYLHKFLFGGDDVFKRVGELSYGQRQKLALACLIVSGSDFLILDEPTSHLDIPALEAVEAALAAYPGPFLVISHDRAFLDAIGVNRVVEMVDGRTFAVPADATQSACFPSGQFP